ncbi:unnamed protein product, partial [Discosporangium mesarthrocarpum]
MIDLHGATTETENFATIQIQRVVRGFKGRIEALKHVNDVVEKVYDPRTGGYYYFNTVAQTSSWAPPAIVKRILGEYGDLDRISSTYTDDQAAVMLQTAWRCRMAKKMTRMLVVSMVTKIHDPSTGGHYYYNSITGETSWNKPLLMGQEDVEDYLEALEKEDRLDQVEDMYETGLYSYEVSEERGAASCGGRLQQDQYTAEGGEQGEPTDTEGYEGWTYTESAGWYFDEELAARLLKNKKDGGKVDNVKDEGAETGDDGSSSEGYEREGMGRGEATAGSKSKRAAPRQYPRSKAQRLVDEVEDSVEGARPERLDLSGLKAERISARVYQLAWLRELSLARNCLRRVSPDIAEMEGLVRLDVSYNRLKTIPSEMEALTRVEELNLSHNKILDFPGNIYLLSSLQRLDLSHNRLKQVPLQVGDLQLLKRTREWEVGLGLLKSLQSLDASYNRLEAWPPQVELCTTLEDLRLKHNYIKEAPSTVGSNTGLVHLDVSQNLLRRLPDSVNSLKSLRVLDASHNRLGPLILIKAASRRDKDFLASITELRLEHNQLEEAPASIDSLTTLTKLNLSENPLKDWKISLSSLKNMKSLKLNGLGLKECPEGIAGMARLNVLELSRNCIPRLDPRLGGLFKLCKLDVKDNIMTELDKCVGNMVSLTYLDVGGNSLSTLPIEIFRCVALEHLDCGGGNISDLPEEIMKLTSLRYLRAPDNQLVDVPKSLSCLTTLEELRLEGNRLTSLPDDLATLKKMYRVDLSRNRMDEPPPVTCLWP